MLNNRLKQSTINLLLHIGKQYFYVNLKLLGVENISNTYTITWNGRKTTFELPEKQVRYWDNNIKIKFYHRGTRGIHTVYKSLMEGNFKTPRNETQLYINGKYFIKLSWNTTKDNERVITEMIQYLYVFG